MENTIIENTIMAPVHNVTADDLALSFIGKNFNDVLVSLRKHPDINYRIINPTACYTCEYCPSRLNFVLNDNVVVRCYVS
jgi:hypothetical protein